MRKAALLMTFAALLATGASAQRGRGFAGGAAPSQGATVESRYERWLDRLGTQLNLTEGQKAQFKAALDALQAKVQTLAEQARQLHVQLAEAIRSNAGAPTIRALAEKLGKIHAELIAARAETMLTLRGLLTQEQRDKFDKLCPRGCGLGWGVGGPGLGRGPGGLGLSWGRGRPW